MRIRSSASARFASALCAFARASRSASLARAFATSSWMRARTTDSSRWNPLKIGKLSPTPSDQFVSPPVSAALRLAQS